MLSRDRLATFFIMRHPDEDIQRRGQNLVLVLWGLLALTIFSIPTTIITNQLISQISIAIAILAFIGLLVLAHQGRITLAALLLITSNTSILVAISSGAGNFIATGYFFTLNILIAGVALRPWSIGVTLLVNLVALILTAQLVTDAPQEIPTIWRSALNAALLLGFATLIATLGAVTSGHALRQARQAREQLAAANTALATANSDLEQRVAERTAALSTSLREQEHQARSLQEALATQERLNELITQLSLPVIPINQYTLVVPLVGAFDSNRAELLERQVLAQIETYHARNVILDVTGVPIVDSHVAKALLQTARASRLLGARGILVGIRPEVAQSLISLGVDLSDLQTRATLQQGLELVNQR